MPFFVNPFKKHDVSEFEGVLIPLEDAQRHPSVVAAHDEKLGTVNGVPKDEKGAEAGEDLSAYSAYTIEGLRAEIDSDVAASGHDTSYDSKSYAFLWTCRRLSDSFLPSQCY